MNVSIFSTNSLSKMITILQNLSLLGKKMISIKIGHNYHFILISWKVDLKVGSLFLCQ